MRRWASNELRQRASALLVCNKRKKRRRVGQIQPKSILLLVFEPVARSPPNYVHADHSKMPGECGRQTIEIPAVARQPMDADDDSMLTWVSPFAVRNTMKTVRIECKKAMLVRLRCHVRLKNIVEGSHCRPHNMRLPVSTILRRFFLPKDLRIPNLLTLTAVLSPVDPN